MNSRGITSQRGVRMLKHAFIDVATKREAIKCREIRVSGATNIYFPSELWAITKFIFVAELWAIIELIFVAILRSITES